ncbi:hypothetical protein AWB75_04060 [Caballeronia catudaia]|uniref:Uncharacterized protein n=1 Tax=Caballeronia catudaia TaxID=1777136 RepID=A0A158BUK1_9BURK|nr:hypothetical protein [Caballeronia catudaia]SAK73764.1 hypothetical protein AWB75_04060 [Caballeronia catudaia]
MKPARHSTPPTQRPRFDARAHEQKALDFLVAVVNTRETSRELPPVRAVSAGLIPAWQAWARSIEQLDATRHPELHLSARPDFGPPGASQAAMDLFAEAVRINNPSRHAILTQEEVLKVALLFSSAALYQTRAHAVIEPTDALQTWLAHTDVGSDVPASMLQLPFPAVLIRFGEQMASAVDASLWGGTSHPFTTRGVYIFETRREGYRELVFTAVGATHEHRQELPHTLQLVFHDGSDSLIDHVVRLEQDTSLDHSRTSVPMIQMCIKVLLYLQTAGAMRIDDLRNSEIATRLTRVGGKKVSKLERRLATRYNRIIVGPAQIVQVHSHLHGEMPPHWRRGHMRMQAHGPQHSLRKLIFIAPTLIRADRLNESGKN